MDRLEAEILKIERALLWGRDIMDDPDFQMQIDEEIDFGKYALFKARKKVYVGKYFLTKERRQKDALRYRYEKNAKTGEIRIELMDDTSERKFTLEFDGKQGFAISEENNVYPLQAFTEQKPL